MLAHHVFKRWTLTRLVLAGLATAERKTVKITDAGRKQSNVRPRAAASPRRRTGEVLPQNIRQSRNPRSFVLVGEAARAYP